LEQTAKGQAVLAKMDGDKQVNAGIPQIHLEGIHGLREDGAIDHHQTTTFILMKHGKKKGALGKGRTNKGITPTVLHYLLPKKQAPFAARSMAILSSIEASCNARISPVMENRFC
jgi:hypothetical protein